AVHVSDDDPRVRDVERHGLALQGAAAVVAAGDEHVDRACAHGGDGALDDEGATVLALLVAGALAALVAVERALAVAASVRDSGGGQRKRCYHTERHERAHHLRIHPASFGNRAAS